MKKYVKNIKNYELINYFNATILIWGVMILYYNFKELSFLQIALLQSTGSIMTICNIFIYIYHNNSINYEVHRSIETYYRRKS